ncbi:gamma-glutamylcyclotransferase family protein [Brevibacillus borstelensis]|uniref:gamma-glutamylcyclotransferase family protein n=1 Tax=Brevibacillus borstelensis TaxID=45462 RepID=UPI0030BCE4D8
MTRILPVFVYGSLLPGFGNHNMYVKPYSHTLQPAVVRGHLYHFSAGYPGLLRSESGTVKGALLTFSSDVYEEALAGLDELEDYFGPGDPRNEYERIVASAMTIAEGEEVQAFLYRYAKEDWARREGIYIPSGDWRRYMQYRG